MIIFDTETTGLVGPRNLPLRKQPYIIEFAAIKIDQKKILGDKPAFDLISCEDTGKSHKHFNGEVDRIEFFCEAPFQITEEITKHNGITQEMVEGAGRFDKYLPQLSKFFLGEEIIIAHNCKFDIDMLWCDLSRKGMVERFPWPRHHICTVEKAMGRHGRRMRLGELYEEITGQEIKGWHRAMADVESLTEIVFGLLESGELKLPL